MKQKNIVLFDMDNTLVMADTVQLWGEFLQEKGWIDLDNQIARDQFHQDYMAGTLDLSANYRHEIITLKQIPLTHRHALRQEFFESRVKPKISLKGMQLIQEHKQAADTLVLLITATISFIAQPIAEYAQFDDLIATEEEIIDGEFTGHVAGIASIGDGKVIRLQQWLQQRGIEPIHQTLYSDSFNDIPLLTQVDRPVVVDPDEILKHLAREKCWEVTTFA